MLQLMVMFGFGEDDVAPAAADISEAVPPPPEHVVEALQHELDIQSDPIEDVAEVVVAPPRGPANSSSDSSSSSDFKIPDIFGGEPAVPVVSGPPPSSNQPMVNVHEALQPRVHSTNILKTPADIILPVHNGRLIYYSVTNRFVAQCDDPRHEKKCFKVKTAKETVQSQELAI